MIISCKIIIQLFYSFQAMMIIFVFQNNMAVVIANHVRNCYNSVIKGLTMIFIFQNNMAVVIANHVRNCYNSVIKGLLQV